MLLRQIQRCCIAGSMNFSCKELSLLIEVVEIHIGVEEDNGRAERALTLRRLLLRLRDASTTLEEK